MNYIVILVAFVAMLVALFCAFLAGAHVEAHKIRDARILAGISLLFLMATFVWLGIIA